MPRQFSKTTTVDRWEFTRAEVLAALGLPTNAELTLVPDSADAFIYAHAKAVADRDKTPKPEKE